MWNLNVRLAQAFSTSAFLEKPFEKSGLFGQDQYSQRRARAKPTLKYSEPQGAAV